MSATARTRTYTKCSRNAPKECSAKSRVARKRKLSPNKKTRGNRDCTSYALGEDRKRAWTRSILDKKTNRLGLASPFYFAGLRAMFLARLLTSTHFLFVHTNSQRLRAAVEPNSLPSCSRFLNSSITRCVPIELAKLAVHVNERIACVTSIHARQTHASTIRSMMEVGINILLSSPNFPSLLHEWVPPLADDHRYALDLRRFSCPGPRIPLSPSHVFSPHSSPTSLNP
eukprot:5926765-Pleurochrysis_carterae.AAC.6